MPQIPKSHQTDHIGVASVKKMVCKLTWIFRKQDPDYGIDAQIEIVSNETPTGKIIAAQIKSGPSYLSENTTEGIVYRGSKDELNYWLAHKLPVIVIIYDPERDVAYWQSVSEEHFTETGKGWKMTIPFDQTLDATRVRDLEKVAEGPPYYQRLSRLQLAKTWMQSLADGNRLVISAEEWVNRSSGKCEFQMIEIDEEGEESVVMEWGYFVFYPGRRFSEGVQMMFSWADVSIDEEYYYYHEDVDEYYIGHLDPLRPYTDSGEVAYWRLELTLNSLGQAFLLTDRFLSGEED